MATLLPDGRVLIVGGFGPDFEGDLAEVWDPATASFEAAGSLAESRRTVSTRPLTATLLPDGRVLVLGALVSEVWDPATASFRATGPPIQDRTDHTATLLPEGRVLVIGGRDGRGRWLSVAETFEFLPAAE